MLDDDNSIEFYCVYTAELLYKWQFSTDSRRYHEHKYCNTDNSVYSISIAKSGNELHRWKIHENQQLKPVLIKFDEKNNIQQYSPNQLLFTYTERDDFGDGIIQCIWLPFGHQTQYTAANEEYNVRSFLQSVDVSLITDDDTIFFDCCLSTPTVHTLPDNSNVMIGLFRYTTMNELGEVRSINIIHCWNVSSTQLIRSILLREIKKEIQEISVFTNSMNGQLEICAITSNETYFYDWVTGSLLPRKLYHSLIPLQIESSFLISALKSNNSIQVYDLSSHRVICQTPPIPCIVLRKAQHYISCLRIERCTDPHHIWWFSIMFAFHGCYIYRVCGEQVQLLQFIQHNSVYNQCFIPFNILDYPSILYGENEVETDQLQR